METAFRLLVGLFMLGWLVLTVYVLAVELALPLLRRYLKEDPP